MDNTSPFFKPLALSGLLLLSANAQALNDLEETESTNASADSNVEQVEPYNRFVTDRLYEFIHSGGSTQYRIIGRVAAGEEVKIIARDSNTGWLQIEQSNGKQGWIKESVLVRQAGAKAQLELAQEQIKTLEQSLQQAKDANGSDEIIAGLNSDVSNLTLENEELNRQVKALQQQNAQIEPLKAKNTELENSIVKADQTQKILDRLYDAGAVLLGVFAGWILTRRRKSSLSFDRL